MSKEIKSHLPARVEHVWLPDKMPPQGTVASYDFKGNPEQNGSVTIANYGVQFVWARFREPVKAGQVAMMVFGNMLPRAVVLDGAATEWDMSADRPTIGDAVVELIAVERGMREGRIVCRNTHHADLPIAAGIAAPIDLPLG
jgi:hypothetical protein